MSHSRILVCYSYSVAAMDSSDSPLVRYLLTSWRPTCSIYLNKIVITYFSSSDAEMFSKLYRTFTSSRFLRDRIQNVAAVKCDGRCTRSKNFHQGAAAPTQQQPKFVNSASRRSLKCSVGVLFLQRQFMRNLCLVQTKSNKDSPQSNSTDSASLKLEQTQCGLSAILSGFKGYASTVDVNQNVPYQNAHTRFKNLCNTRHYHSNAMTNKSCAFTATTSG